MFYLHFLIPRPIAAPSIMRCSHKPVQCASQDKQKVYAYARFYRGSKDWGADHHKNVPEPCMGMQMTGTAALNLPMQDPNETM